MIDVQGWFSWAERIPGPLNKTWPETNLMVGAVYHSAVGSLQGVIDTVMGPEEKSVTGVVGQDGRFVQFYPVTLSPWANGSHYANSHYLGFEFEGGAAGNEGEPLTDAQINVGTRILADLAVYKNVSTEYWVRPTTLIEHREIFPTACPSGRIPWQRIIDGLVVPPPSTQDVIYALVSAAQFARLGYNFADLSDEDKVALRWVVSGL